MGNIIYLGSAKPSSGSGGGSGGGAVWGAITGELGNQTDLASALASKIANNATGSNALTILGVAGIGANGINIGTGSRGAYNGVAIGNTAATYGGSDIAIGQNATSNLGDAIVIGHNAESFSPYTVTMGYGSINGGSAAVDDATESIAIGMYAINRHQDSIALGCRAVSSADKQFMVGFGLDQSDNPLMYELLDGTTGKIPNARINAMVGATSLAAGSAGLVPAPTTSDVDKYLKGDGTWAAVSGGGIQNTTASAGSIGLITSNSVGTNAFVFGDLSEGGNGSICIGLSSACADDSIALGTWSKASGVCSTAIGSNAYATGDYSIAIGTGASAENDNEFIVAFVDAYDSSIQYKLLDGTTGKIPNDRINADVTPTQNSTNMITSGAVYTVLGDIETLLAAI